MIIHQLEIWGQAINVNNLCKLGHFNHQNQIRPNSNTMIIVNVKIIKKFYNYQNRFWLVVLPLAWVLKTVIILNKDTRNVQEYIYTGKKILA